MGELKSLLNKVTVVMQLKTVNSFSLFEGNFGI